MSVLPPARVVHDGLAPTLSPPPRRVPLRLWLKLVFGNVIAQVGWWALAVIAGGMVYIQWRNAPLPKDDMPMSWAAIVAMVACAPVIGAAGWQARRRLRLLSHGIPTTGTLVRKLDVQTGEGSAWDYVFSYKRADGEQDSVTIRAEVTEPRLEDDACEPMVYLPDARGVALPLDHLPGHPAISGTGELIARNPHVMLVLLGPIAAIAALVLLFARA